MAMGLSGMIMAAVLGSLVFIARSSFSVANYSMMNSESRMGLEIFGRDVRNGENIKPGFSSTEFTVQVPKTGGGFDEITYVYRPNSSDRAFVRIDSNGEESLMTGVEDLNINYYNLQAGPATVPLEVKQIQLQLKLVRNAVALQNTEKVVSARFILRNKEVAK